MKKIHVFSHHLDDERDKKEEGFNFGLGREVFKRSLGWG